MAETTPDLLPCRSRATALTANQSVTSQPET